MTGTPRSLFLLFFLTVTLSLAAQPASAPFTLEQVLSAPFPGDLTAAPTGERVAWIFNDRGARNLWLAEAPDWRGRPLTNYRGDDGQQLSELTFTPDGERLIFVRGGAPNRAGEIPNPTSAPEAAKRQLWIAAAGGGAPRVLADGGSPLVHPDGGSLTFLNRGQVWRLDLRDETPRPRQLFQIRGTAAGLCWSPDGARLAFVSNRGDYAFIGIYDTTTQTLRYLAPSVDRDAEPVWSPDGARLAWLRFPRERGLLPFIPRPEGMPWSILVADAASGEVRVAWTAPAGAGSAFREISAGQQLFWAAGDRLVFPYEGDGWTHLWAVPAAGGEARCLTPGAFEVQYVSISPDGRSMLYSSNQDDTDRQHVWRVAVAGGAPARLTPGTGIEWAPVMTAGGQAAVLASGGRIPAYPARLGPKGELISLAPDAIPADFPAGQLVEPQAVIFSAADGLSIHGQLFLPRDLKAGERRPAIAFFHGGSRRQMLLGFHHRDYYHNTYAMNQYLAAQGYVVLSVNFRSGIGYGLVFREAANYGADGASEFNDVLGAGLYLRGRPDVDPARIGLWGGSYGGYLTALGLARASDLYAAGVDLHGVHDWNVVIRNFVPSYDPRERPELARRAFESSPLASLSTWRSPVLLIHGDDDRNVPFSETVDIAESLRRQGVEFEQLIFPDEVHGFLLHRNWLAAFRATAGFFGRKLADGKK